jgi:hypothetical protein
MQDGIYKVSFFLGANQGNGVVTVLDNKISGGDGSFAYKGSINQASHNIYGSIKVWQHSAGVNVFGGLTSFQLSVQGVDSGNTVKLEGTTPSALGSTVHIELVALEPL